jgi:pimeloyl-ACP methyl ester carboxylesterase
LPCGDIVAPGDWQTDLWLENPIEAVPIIDCDLPFGETDEWDEGERKLVFKIEGLLVRDGDVFEVLDGRTNKYDFEYNFLSDNSVYGHVIFRHQNNNYEFVDSRVVPLTETDYRELAIEFGVVEDKIEEYVARMMSNDPYEDLVYGTSEFEEFNEFDSFTYTSAQTNYPYLEAGTYTIVYHLYEQESAWDEAYLASRHADTFTITGVEVEPTGASSVLFLPGIQASRLYSDGAAGTENQLWEPNVNSDVEQLGMTVSGGSINNIYTRDVVDELNVLPLFQSNIYKGFLRRLKGLVDDDVIQAYLPFAYDWRYSVEDVVLNGTRYQNEVMSVVAAVEELAENSFTGKVTMIGHSNGGLLAKVLIGELERQGKSDLVDKVVFIGTPHLGTPKAIATVLHGYDQQKLGGAIIDDSTARAVINNMPGVYGLLPSQRYLELADSSIISVLEGPATSPMYNAFGGEVEGVDEYRNILIGLEGRTNDYWDISNPYKANPYMLQSALDMHAELDYWEAPEGMAVFNLAGVGLPTISKVEYRNVTERINCLLPIFGGMICDTVNILRPYAHFTQYGDETVTSLSSETVVGETYYFDFVKYDEDTISLFNPEHADFTEVEKVQDYIKEIIVDGNPSSSTYISETSPNFSREYEVTSIDSPVRIVKEDSSGNRTGVVINEGVAEIVTEIPGSEYIEFGGTKYVIIPKDEDTATYLYGEALGSYTLTTATLAGDEQVIETQLVNATTTPTMTAQYEFTGGVYSTIQTDYDGDGNTDLEMTLSGEVIHEPEITFDVLRSQIIDLGLSNSRVKSLLLLVDLAEKAEKLKVNPKISKRISDGLLAQLRDTIKLYVKKKWITQEQQDNLIESINKFLDL